MRKKTFVSVSVFLLLLFLSVSANAANNLFEPYKVFSIGSWPEAVAIGDLNNDGKNDVALLTGYYFSPGNDNTIFIYLQNESGGLNSPIKIYTNCGQPTSIEIGDTGNDRINEIVVSCFRSNIGVYSGDFAAGNFKAYYRPGDYYMTKLADLNNDGVNELVAIGWGTNTVDIFSHVNPRFFPVSPYDIFGSKKTLAIDHDGWDDLDAGDIDGNGLKDVVVMSGQGWGPNFGILYQQAYGWQPAVYYGEVGSGFDLASGIAVGDITNDGRDEVSVSRGGNKPYSFVDVYDFNISGQPFLTTYPSYDLPSAAEIGQMDYDGKNDLAVLHDGWNAVGIYLQDENGNLLPEELYTIPRTQNYSPKAMAVGDINSDGLDDIVIAADSGLAVLYHHKPTPDIRVSFTGIDFGRVKVGSNTIGFLEVSNAGDGDLEIFPNRITGLESPFYATNDDCTGRTLVPGASCIITLMFEPTSEGAFGDMFYIVSNDPGTPSAQITVYGTGLPLVKLSVDIKVNGSDGPIMASKRKLLNIFLSLKPNDYEGRSGEMWLVKEHGRHRQYFNGRRWLVKEKPLAVKPLSALSNRYIISELLRPGEYDYLFCVDTTVDGKMGSDAICDGIGVTVTKK